MKIAVFFLLPFSFSSLVLKAQECNWFEGEGTCRVVNISPELAKKKALNEAREKAKEKFKGGVKITEQTYRSVTETVTGSDAREFYDTYLKFFSHRSDARIVKEEEPIFSSSLDGIDQIIKVKLKACVTEEKGSIDQNFKADILLNKTIFYDKSYGLGDGEEIKFNLKASKDCFLYLFNISSNDSVILIFPNKYITDNRFIFGKKEQDFEKKMKMMTMSFHAELPEGKDNVVEGFFLVALKDKIDPPAEIFSDDNLNKTITYETSYRNIMNWLGGIPLDKQFHTFEAYEIRKK